MKENLACLMSGHRPSAIMDFTFNDGKPRTVCLYCEEVIHYVGDVGFDEWKTKEEMDKTNDRPTGFDPDYP